MKPRALYLLVASSMAALAGDFQILSFGGNGQLTWTNAFPNALYSVEWAPTTSGVWTDSWTSLKSFAVGGPVSTAQVPMFYRVKCVTNLVLPLPIGSWMMMTVSNAVGNVWTQQTTVVGTLYLPSKGKEFTVMEMVNPINPPNAPLIPIRSTESAVYGIDMDCGAEALWFTNAPIGASWTNSSCGHTTIATNEATESVTVPAGTFTCVRVRKQNDYSGSANPVWIEWWKPGFGQVKWIDYNVNPSENPPLVYQLIGYSSNPR